ncbi:MAG: DUF6531 domain-containing protein, partial [Chloroflexota bacterium]
MALSIDDIVRNLLVIVLEDGREIRSDFAELRQMSTQGNLLEIYVQSTQRIVVDSTSIRLTTGTTGISGLVVDGTTITLDKVGWDVLAVLDSIAWARIDDSTHIRSEILNLDLRQREDGRYGLSLAIFDREIDLRLDPLGIARLDITPQTLQLDMQDGRTIEEGLFTLSSLDTEARAVRVAREDGSALVVLPDDTRLAIPETVPATNSDALPHEPEFAPSHFNNLGTTVSDYHPRWDTDHSLLPVNRVNGNLIYPVTDIAIAGEGITLGWSRTYNSLGSDSVLPAYDSASLYGTFGIGWTHRYQIGLDITYATHADTPQIKLSLPDGSQHIFTPTDNSRSIFRSRILRSWTLARQGDVIGTWEARTSEGVVYRFDEAGCLQSIHDAQGNVLVFSPIPQGRLGRYGATGGFFVSDAFGRRIEVYTNSDNLIIAVRDMQGRELSYGYDDNNQLSQVTYRGTQGTAMYSYNAEGRLIELADSQSPYHQTMTFAYNERGQVATWTLVGDDTTHLAYQLSYDNQRTTQTQRINDNDEREQVWIFDNDFRLLQATPSAVIGAYSYVYQGDLLTRIVQPDDAELALSYDDRGYLTIINDPISAQNYTFSYEETVDNQVRLLIVNVPNVTLPYMQLSYDADGRLITIQRALDETTSTTTRYRYDDPRLPYHLTEIAHGIETSDPVLRRYHYDNFGYVSAIEVGQTSSVEIDEYAQRWSLVHDITGQLRLVTDSSGVTTAIGWEDAVGEIATITVDDMLTDTQYSYRYDYDEAGNLLAITEPDNITTRYAYDALNRLTQVIEPLTVPTGEDTPTRTTTYVYNVAGD